MRSTFIRVIAAVARWVRRRFTTAGIYVLVLLVISAAYGMDTNRSLAYQMFTFLAALLVLALVSNLGPLPRLEAERELPRAATAGEPIRYRLKLRNLGRKRHNGLTVAEEDLAANATLQIPESKPMDLAPSGLSEIQTEVTPERRGKLNLESVSVYRPDLLGLSRRRQTLSVHNSILVLPRRYRVPRLNLPGHRKYQPGGVALSSSIGESLEFESLRDYRPGDPIRRIHWRSWARTGKLIVKEYQDEYFVRHGLVLDTFPATADPQIFEEAVSVAASFACSVLTQDSLLDLLFVGQEAYRFTAGRGLGGPEKMLEVLACVEPCRTRPFRDLHDNVAGGHHALSGCICVLVAWDDARKEFIRHLESLRVPVVVAVIAGREDPLLSAVLPRNVHALEAGRIAEGLARL